MQLGTHECVETEGLTNSCTLEQIHTNTHGHLIQITHAVDTEHMVDEPQTTATPD